MGNRYPRVYKLLKNAGHSPAKAIEIIIDASRGNEWAMEWLKLAFKHRPMYR